METLKNKLRDNRAAVIRDLDLNMELLTLLSDKGVMDIMDCVQLQQTSDTKERNQKFLEKILKIEDESLYVNLINCLQRAGQTTLANMLVDVGEEMLVLSHMQIHLDTQLKEMSDFLKIEERRVGIYLTEPPPDDEEGTPALTEKEVWEKVQDSIKRSQQLLARCQSVIRKLHRDCEIVAKQNSDIVGHTREVDEKIKAVLSAGRHSAKQSNVPKKTQDVFASLMDDIEKLVKTRKKVITKETEGRRHSTRIVRQCRDWLEGRCVALQKLNAAQTARGFESPNDGEISVNIQREAPPINDNAIMSILESLQLLEKDLQEYIHLEVILSDKYRAEMRRKHLQKKVHGFNAHGISDMERALKGIERDPASVKENVEFLQSCVGSINREYGECLAYLNKIDPNYGKDECSEGNLNGSPQIQRKEIRPNPRGWPTMFKKKGGLGNKMTRSMDNNLNKAGMTGREHTEPNEMLKRIKYVVKRYDELKAEDQNLESKYRLEASKKKRDTDILLQKKEDLIIRLQTQLKESEAEKEKYKKLYNDTKIGYQRNSDSNR